MADVTSSLFITTNKTKHIVANNKQIEATNLPANIYINYIHVYGCVKGFFQLIF